MVMRKPFFNKDVIFGKCSVSHEGKGFLTHSAHLICFLIPKVDLLSEFDGIIEATY
jgi:hypothetical protein